VSGSPGSAPAARSRNGVPIRLPDERWFHIVAGHPAMVDQRPRLLETLREPDLIQQGVGGELLAIRFYEQTPLTRKFLVVAYRETSPTDGFVITAYFARRITTQRVVLWKR
jgi:hypothetical protein